jgi:hypothetical protein
MLHCEESLERSSYLVVLLLLGILPLTHGKWCGSSGPIPHVSFGGLRLPFLCSCVMVAILERSGQF